jgi:hypothetical protein
MLRACVSRAVSRAWRFVVIVVTQCGYPHKKWDMDTTSCASIGGADNQRAWHNADTTMRPLISHATASTMRETCSIDGSVRCIDVYSAHLVPIYEPWDGAETSTRRLSSN